MLQEVKMTTLTITLEGELAQILQAALHNQSITAEELVKRALYQYLEEEQLPESVSGDDNLVGLFDLGDPLLSEKSEEILQTMFAEDKTAARQ
jgi:c-di-GMP-related signal transduction protein